MRSWVIAVSILISGCASVADQAEEVGNMSADALIHTHNRMVVRGRELMCGTSLRAFMAEFGGDDELLLAALRVCQQERLSQFLSEAK